MATTTSAKTVRLFFNEYQTVKFVRLHWVDYSGVLRVRTITVQRCRDLANGKSSYHLAQNCLVVPISTAPRCWPDGIENWTLWPDWSSLMVCGFRTSHASVMCFIGRSLPQTHADMEVGLSTEKSSFARCPRTLLCQALNSIHQSLPQGTRLLMGFELEFVLLNPTSLKLASTPTVSTDPIIGYSTISGLRDANLDIVEETIDALKLSGIEIYHFHIEIANQIEIALSPKSPLEAIDALMIAQETIKSVFLRHELKATMTPRPVIYDGDGGDAVYTGCHFHLSLNNRIDSNGEAGMVNDGSGMPGPDTEGPTRTTKYNSIMESFLAGVLQKTGALCAFGMPNYDSYCRIKGDCAGEWIGWGTHNKDMPIRQFNRNRWEFRALDMTANVYLFVAAVLLCGTAGIRAKQSLHMRDCQVLPSTMEAAEVEQQLKEFGITERLPTTLRAALDCAKADPDLRAWIGDEIWDQYMKVKEKEIEHFSFLGDTQRRLKFLQYF